MITALYRMIVWAKHYGLSKEEICELLNCLADDSSIAEAEDSVRLETVLQEIVPAPGMRAEMFYRLLMIDPNEEIEPEDVTAHLQFLPLFLHAVKEILETVGSREEAVSAIDAILAKG